MDDYEEDEFEEHDEEDGHAPVYCGKDDDLSDAVGRLKDIFGRSLYTDEEFFQLSTGELFGMTDNQLKFIDVDILERVGVEVFLSEFHCPATVESVPDVEQRIKYALALGLSNGNYVYSGLEHRYREEDSSRKINGYVKKLALNNSIHKAVQLIQLYKDYIRFYGSGMDMNKERRENGQLEFSYVLCPKVSHLKDLHDKAMRDDRVIQARKSAAQKKEQNKKIKSVTTSPDYRRFLKKGEKYSIIAPVDVDDMQREAGTLNHCVDSYLCEFSMGATGIYFVRRNKEIDIPFYTLEVKLNTRNGKYELLQCFGYDNTVEKSEELREFLYGWMKRCGIKQMCPV